MIISNNRDSNKRSNIYNNVHGHWHLEELQRQFYKPTCTFTWQYNGFVTTHVTQSHLQKKVFGHVNYGKLIIYSKSRLTKLTHFRVKNGCFLPMISPSKYVVKVGYSWIIYQIDKTSHLSEQYKSIMPKMAYRKEGRMVEGRMWEGRMWEGRMWEGRRTQNGQKKLPWDVNGNEMVAILLLAYSPNTSFYHPPLLLYPSP